MRWALPKNRNCFPRILGFCRTDHLECNFISLLQEGSRRFSSGYYSTYGTVHSVWQLARQALHIAEDDESTDWGAYEELMALEECVRAALLREGDEHGTGELLARIRSIHVSIEERCGRGLILAEIITKAGGEPALAAIEQKLPEWELAFEEEEVRIDAARRVVLRPHKKAVDEWVNVLIGERATSLAAKLARSHRRLLITRFIEDYVIQNGAMPVGKHEVGRATQGMGAHIRVIDFDDVAKKAAFNHSRGAEKVPLAKTVVPTPTYLP